MRTAALQAHLAVAKELLECSVADDEVFHPTVLVLRGDRLIAQVLPPPPLPDGDPGTTVARTAQVCAEGFGADEIVIVADTYMRIGDAVDRHPVTGQDYRNGDLEDLVVQHDALARGWVTETLSVLAVPRTGSKTMWALPYLREADRTVTWGDPQDVSDGEGRLTELFLATPIIGGRLSDGLMLRLLGRLGCDVALAVYEDNRS